MSPSELSIHDLLVRRLKRRVEELETEVDGLNDRISKKEKETAAVEYLLLEERADLRSLKSKFETDKKSMMMEIDSKAKEIASISERIRWMEGA